MPAGKDVQLNSPSDVNGHYVNGNYSEGGYQQHGNNFNGYCWEQKNSENETQHTDGGFMINRSMKKWVQQEPQVQQLNYGFNSCSNHLVNHQEKQQKFITKRELCNRENRSHTEDNRLPPENGGRSYYINQVLHSQTDWRGSPAQNESSAPSYDLNQSEVYDEYPFCSSFRPSSNGAPRLCCNDNPRVCSSNTAGVGTMNHTGSDVFLPPYHGQRPNNRVCTQQPRSTVERMSQVDLAIEHCPQAEAEAKQLYSHRNDQMADRFPGRLDPVNFNFDQVIKSKNYLSKEEKQSPTEFSQMKNRTIHANNTLPQHPTCTSQNYNPSTNCVVGDYNDSTSHHSVSSDPEIYTKSPSVAKLNANIQKLREEMLALRSTTFLYKEYMEKMFDDLKLIARMNEGNPTWASPGITHRAFADQSVNHRLENISLLGYARLHTENDDTLIKINSKDEDIASKSTTPSPINKDEKESPRVLPSYENVMDARLRPQASKPTVDSDNNAFKRNKPNERPTSDPFCAGNKDIAFSSNPGGPISTMSLPHTQSRNKYPKKSAGSSLENEANRSKGCSDQLRILPVLSKSNAALHISECSIDSGYQGSSVTSPREKQGRDLSSQAVTPASPINESPVQQDGEEQEVIENNDESPTVEVLTVSCEPVKSPNMTIMSPTIFSQFIEDKPNQTYSCTDGGSPKDIVTNGERLQMETLNNLGHAQESFQPPKIVKLKSYDGPSSACSNNDEMQSTIVPKTRTGRKGENEDFQKRQRPIPKQRTVFTLDDKPDQLTSPNQVCPLNVVKPEETAKLYSEHQQLLNANKQNFKETSKDMQSSKSFSEDIHQNMNSTEQHSRSVRPTPPHCLAIIKHPSQTTNATGSPVQSRVKLGISSIKQYTPNSESKEGSIFYCTGQVSKPTDVATRLQKTTNTKQLLREKFSAVFENSSSSAPDNGSVAIDSELSTVRRRSMRMMTEFQIFDFKDAIGSLNMSKAEVKSSCKPKIPNNPKYLSSSVSNRLSKSTSSSSYSVSPSAATVSKEIFQVETNKKPSKVTKLTSNSLRKTKFRNSEPSESDKSQNLENDSASNTEKPLPLSPPTSPRSPPMMANNPTQLNSSPISLVSEAELVPKELTDDVFQAQLIRPKPSLPGVSCDTGPPEVPVSSLNGLKISSNAKSAFIPVLSGSSLSLTTKSSPVFGTHKASNNDKTAVSELHRRVSLPTSFISNKQRFLKEFMPNSLEYEHNDYLAPGLDVNNSASVQSSFRMPQKQNESCTIVKMDNKTRSHTVLQENDSKNKLWKKQPFTSTEPLFSKIPKNDVKAGKEKEIRRHASFDKMLFSSSSNDRQDLECVPIPFNRADKMVDMTGELQNAGFPGNRNNNNALQQDAKVSSGNEKHTKEDNLQASHTPQSPTRPARPNYLGQLQSCHKKSNSSSAIHKYIVAQSNHEDKVKASNKIFGHKNASSQEKFIILPEGGAPSQVQSPTRSHKSTVAIIKASLMGKREKHTRSTTAEGKKDASKSNEYRSRSASAGAKKKTTTNVPFDGQISAAKSKSKDLKAKKNKNDPKQIKEKASATRNGAKDRCPKMQENKHQKHAFSEVLPFSPSLPNGPMNGYNDPCSEEMERFLTAAASQTPRSPLQRLKSSFRVQKNKTKLLNSSRIKDDMDISRLHSINPGSQFDKAFPHGQEFTYV